MIRIETLAGRTPEKKAELIAALTDTVTQVVHAERATRIVLIEERYTIGWGVGSKFTSCERRAPSAHE